MPSESKFEEFEVILLKATTEADLQKLSTALTNMLWHVAAARGDMSDLPTSLSEHESALATAILAQNKPELCRLIEVIISDAVLPHVTEQDFTELKIELILLAGLATKAAFTTIVNKITEICKAVLLSNSRIGSVTVDLTEALNVGMHTSISFQRTLRVPDDGHDYPLPAALGSLPIGTKHDIMAEVFELNEVATDSAAVSNLPQVQRIMCWIADTRGEINRLVRSLQSKARENPELFLAALLVTESGTNILNAATLRRTPLIETNSKKPENKKTTPWR